MKGARVLIAGLGISLLLHGVGSAYFAKDPDDVSVAASQGGAVSVIGSIEDMVAGAKVEAVEAEKPVDEVEPLEEIVEPVQEPVEIEPLKPVEEVVQPVVEPAEVKPVEVEAPVEIAALDPVKPVSQPTKVVKSVTTAAAVPVVEGVTTTEKVTEPVEAADVVPQEAKPVREQTETVEQVTAETTAAKPVEVTPQKPVQMALAVQPEVQPVQEAVRPETEQLQAVPETVRTPVAKPKPPVKKAEPVKKKKPKKQQAKRQQKKGGATNSRKGGEQVTSKTARSNANGRADAKTKDGGTKAASNYKGKVVAKLRRAKRYPRAAKRARLTGTVRIAFTIAQNGSVSGIRISRSSGHAILDQAALDMVRRASPMPKFPSDIRLARMKLQVPVRFD
ncbi:TonB family protein [Roseibium sp.]|uniref:energy transducer TonB n=1 Tax=Roseibium sp. TaxID=1936156 RepID=UPI003BB0D20D